MKIGVITYHLGASHGAVFQAYATYRALRELGCEVEVIDKPQNKKSQRPWWQLIILKLYYIPFEIRQNFFRKRFFPPSSKHYKNYIDLKNNPPKVDALCVGSDQTWNIEIATPAEMRAFYLDFGSRNTPRFSYASSFGYDHWLIEDAKETAHIGNLLKHFVGLSVREKTGQKILKEQFNLNATLVCDPTLLHTNYDEFTKGIKQRNDVLCYSLSPYCPNTIKTIHDVSNFIGAPIRWCGKPFYVRGVINTYYPSLETWFRYIAGTKYVVTDSFHGTVASLIFHRSFVVIYKENGLSSRIVDLLDFVGLRDRIYFGYEEFSNSVAWKKSIDWGYVDKQLELYRKESWNYLKDTILKIESIIDGNNHQ